MSIELPGLILSKPLQACGDPVGSRLLGRTMIGGVEFWVDLYEVDSHTMGDSDDYRKGTTKLNEDMITDLWELIGLQGGDWNYVELSGHTTDQAGNAFEIKHSYWILIIYPTLE